MELKVIKLFCPFFSSIKCLCGNLSNTQCIILMKERDMPPLRASTYIIRLILILLHSVLLIDTECLVGTILKKKLRQSQSRVNHYMIPWINNNVKMLGTLRSENGDGEENVAEKVNSRSFNLHSDYSKSLTLSNVGEPSWSWIPKNHIQVQKERGNFVVACVLPLYIGKLGIFKS